MAVRYHVMAGIVLSSLWQLLRTYTAGCREASGLSLVQLIGVGVGVGVKFHCVVGGLMYLSFLYFDHPDPSRCMVTIYCGDHVKNEEFRCIVLSILASHAV